MHRRSQGNEALKRFFYAAARSPVAIYCPAKALRIHGPQVHRIKFLNEKKKKKKNAVALGGTER